jgi:hypothetical protein
MKKKVSARFFLCSFYRALFPAESLKQESGSLLHPDSKKGKPYCINKPMAYHRRKNIPLLLENCKR